MFKAFVFVYFFGAFLLNNISCSNVAVKLNNKQKLLLMAGLNKLKISSNKQEKYNFIIILWQLFWILFLILTPICLKIANNIISNSFIDELCRLYIVCFQNIINIFYVEGITIATDIIIKLIIKRMW